MNYDILSDLCHNVSVIRICIYIYIYRIIRSVGSNYQYPFWALTFYELHTPQRLISHLTSVITEISVHSCTCMHVHHAVARAWLIHDDDAWIDSVMNEVLLSDWMIYMCLWAWLWVWVWPLSACALDKGRRAMLNIYQTNRYRNTNTNSKWVTITHQ